MRAGVAVKDITPAHGTAMSGFAARRDRAAGAHDRLLVEALVVEDTAVITVDVVGLHEDDCAEIRRRCPLGNVVVHATHTHGGPVSMRGRLGAPIDEEWLGTVIDACVECVTEAVAQSEDVGLEGTVVSGLGVAKNRRNPDGPVDDCMPVVIFRRPDQSVLAALVSYACHPVVLGADNLLFTADYPGVVRREMSQQLGGAPVVFMTGFAGDANTGHRAADSITTQGASGRTFEECERIGRHLADRALNVADEGLVDTSDGVTATSARVELQVTVPPADDVLADVARWHDELPTAEDAQAALLKAWIDWGAGQLKAQPDSRNRTGWSGSVTVLRWGRVIIVALPGEPFAIAALRIRQYVNEMLPEAVVITAGYCDGCPGYLPSREEYVVGGYEVNEAHRYYGMPGPFAAGSLEQLLTTARELLSVTQPNDRDSQQS